MNQDSDSQSSAHRTSPPWRTVMLSGSMIVVLLLPGARRSACAEPSEIPETDLILWLDAARPDGRPQQQDPTAPTSQPLTAWSDLSGQANHLRQTDAAHQPQWTSAGPGGRPAVRFEGKCDAGS